MASEDHGIHSFKECVSERSWLPLADSGKSAHKKKLDYNKRSEDGSNWNQALTIQIRFLKWWAICTLIQKDSTHEKTLINLSIWIRNDAVVNEEDDEEKDSKT